MNNTNESPESTPESSRELCSSFLPDGSPSSPSEVDDDEGGQFSEDEDCPVQRTKELDELCTLDEYDTAFARLAMATPATQVPLSNVPANHTVGATCVSNAVAAHPYVLRQA